MNTTAFTALSTLAGALGVQAQLSPASGEQRNDDVVQRALSFEVRNINTEERTADFVFSSESIDSYGEIVRQNWDLSRFKRNPVILYNHTSRSWGDPSASLPIGTCTAIGIKDGKLQGTIKFASERFNPFAEQVWIGVQEKMIRATSVGFFPHTVKYERVDDVELLVLDDNELFEISLVPIGANPDAVALAAGDSAQRERLLRRAGAPVQRQESNMSPEEISKREAALKDAEMRANAAEQEAEALKAKNAELQAIADRAKADEEEARAKAIGAEANGLIGKKFGPASRDAYIELACGPDGDRFKAFVAALPDMPHTKSTTPPETVVSKGSALAERAKKAAADAAAKATQ